MPDEQILERTFEATAVEVEGRTVDVRVVPFGEVARVQDAWDDRPYSEQWMPGVFDHQRNAASRIRAKVDHSQFLTNVVGHGLSLRSESDGYHATFDIHETGVGDTALALIRGGALPAVSLEARPHPKGSKVVNGITQRVKADLRAVAFVGEGAFKGAEVLAVREAVEIDEDLLPLDIDPALVNRMRAQGVVLPDRYQAHPAQSDTSAESDTSADGTRQTDNPSSEEAGNESHRD